MGSYAQLIQDYLYQNEQHKDDLKEKCSTFDHFESCPCVGKAEGTTGNLTSTNTYPGDGVKPCMKEITGDPIAITENYNTCLLASICRHYFQETIGDKLDQMCKLSQECPIPQYTGEYSDHSTVITNEDTYDDDKKQECNAAGFYRLPYSRSLGSSRFKLESRW